MRLLVRRIYRAFPELDGYSDEQCLRFVGATKKRRLVRLGHALAITAVSVAALVGVFFAFALGSAWVDNYQNAARRDILWLQAVEALACLPLAATVPVAGFVTRDRLLRRRLRYVLQSKSACPGCNYKLIGLAVSADHKIRCPECGMVCDVDPSLGELALDESGREQYHPAVIAPQRPKFWTRKRRKWALRIAAAIILVPALGAGSYEGWLRYQAHVARRERPGIEALKQLVEKVQPSATGPNGWDFISAAAAAMQDADAKTWRNDSPQTGAGQSAVPEWTYLYTKPGKPLDQYDTACRDLALRMIGEYQKAGVFDELAKLPSATRAVRPMANSTNGPLIGLTVPDYPPIRTLARVNAARMVMAAKAGRWSDFTPALEQNLALAKALRWQSLLVDSLVAGAIEAQTFHILRSALAAHPDADTLSRWADILEKQTPAVPRTQYLESERISCLDTTAWLFSDPGRVRLGRYSPALTAILGSAPSRASPARLGTFAENRDAFNTLYKILVQCALTLPDQRTALSSIPPPDLILVRSLCGSMDFYIQSMDQADVEIRSAPVLVALERYRAAHGDYPNSLAPLVPDFIATLPTDPWSGKPFGYVRTDPTADAVDRAFLLYSVGADRTDNGGKEQTHDTMMSGRTGTGTDFVVNHESAPEP